MTACSDIVPLAGRRLSPGKHSVPPLVSDFVTEGRPSQTLGATPPTVYTWFRIVNQRTHTAVAASRALSARAVEAAYPQAFSATHPSSGRAAYLNDSPAAKLAEFFNAKGLSGIKEEDGREQWYEDWIKYQAEHRLYAQLLFPDPHTAPQGAFNLLKYARFLELFAYFSPAHGYSLQVTFLGLFPILMGSNEELKKEAVATLRAGGLFGLGVSERAHGSDLLGNEFTVRETAPGRLAADGAKYYIGNANCASILSVLARRADDRSDARSRRAPFVLFVLRPGQSGGMRDVRKIRTLGVRAAFVGEFTVKDHGFGDGDVIAEGRGAWDAIVGTITLGKLFLGFGSIGICEHGLEEAVAHLTSRILYGKPVIEMPHIRLTVARAYARLTAMKLYAYRALDYVAAASESDRRYLLFCAVQKAKVSTEGVKVMEDLLDCMGAKGFESDTYFEMALRDIQLIPRLEGSTHINLALTAQFISRYFANPDPALKEAPSLGEGEAARADNPYLTSARTGAIHAVAFPACLTAYRALKRIANVRLFVRQVKAFRLLLDSPGSKRALEAGGETALALGQCQATIVYAQLIAEHSVRLGVAGPMIAAIFDLLVTDLSVSALALAGSANLDPVDRILVRRLVMAPRTTVAEWNDVSERAAAFANVGRS